MVLCMFLTLVFSSVTIPFLQVLTRGLAEVSEDLVENYLTGA